MNQLVISLIVLLIPGLIAAFVYDSITEHEKWNNFDFSVAAVLFGWFSYLPLYILNLLFDTVFASYINFRFEIFETLLKLLNNGHMDSSIYIDIVTASLFAFLIAFLAAACVNYKILTKFAQRLKISNKYGDENLFYYYLNNKNIDWIYVRDFPKNMTYIGRLNTFSENNGIQELAMFDVEVYGSEDAKSYGHIDTIYLCGKSGDFTIETIHAFSEISPVATGEKDGKI